MNANKIKHRAIYHGGDLQGALARASTIGGIVIHAKGPGNVGPEYGYWSDDATAFPNACVGERLVKPEDKE